MEKVEISPEFSMLVTERDWVLKVPAPYFFNTNQVKPSPGNLEYTVAEADELTLGSQPPVEFLRAHGSQSNVSV